MITYLQSLLENDDTKVLYILGVLVLLMMVDFLLGFTNAKFNNEVTFKSGQALAGIVKKMMYIAVVVVFSLVSLLLPQPIGIGALYTFLFGMLYAELNSILSHLRVTEDGKDHSVFVDFIEQFKTRKGGNSDE